jgi:hypothetical protein
MINRKILLPFCLFLGLSAISYSQTGRSQTDVNKDIDVVRVYEQVVKEGFGTPLIYKKLASAYYFKSDYGKALGWFQKFFAIEKNTDPVFLLQYQQTMKAVAVTTEAASAL